MELSTPLKISPNETITTINLDLLNYGDIMQALEMGNPTKTMDFLILKGTGLSRDALNRLGASDTIKIMAEVDALLDASKK